ncbi:BRF1-domain-containing protein [Melanomma pulvis-pyrius CBS 109.77]|uniref:BRF1-domain-containing protein n=1 Tax=Melanomma pulvis-pyrius CBS 109.77 TaxID=1314802 RepID=A0A6A6WZJ4_9PLEO|nr:BRF1-domain-containing protein [Melanomma pulvis-pyrius CBS 109.77]
MPGPIDVARPRRERLPSLNNPRSAGVYKAKRPSPPAQQPAPTLPSKRDCCENPTISSDSNDGSTMCYNCGAVLSQSEIVAEVTFGENAAGGAVVQGGFVGENQRHANTMGGTMRGLGGMPSREQTEWHGRDEIKKLCGTLHLRLAIEDNAFGWYKLALGHNFVQGRRIRNVAAVAIYFAARKMPENTLLLMDLAEKIHINVWALGDTYKAFLKKLMEQDPAQLINTTSVQEIEPLMLKYCRKLEFDHASHKVANDACEILKRMKRDWMVQGRQPAGLCGACIILAARMNNFRRTIREVVYVVKVADTTINKRLYEYTRTPSSKLTVEQFRKFGNRLKVTTQPPAIWRREEAEERKRKRKRLEAEDEEEAPIEDPGQPESSAAASRKPRSTRKKRKTANGKAKAVTSEQGSPGDATPRLDEDGFAIPDQPIEQTLMDVDNDDHMEYVADALEDDDGLAALPKKFFRKKKLPTIIIPQEDLDIEDEIEAEIEETIKDWESVFGKFKENENHPVLVAAGLRAQALAREHMPNANISNEEEITDELDDDPDIANCLLSPHEVAMKERVWITENEDWLRVQQAKILAKALEEASGKVKKPKQRRKHHQMGDGSVLEGQPAANAADAVQKMLKKRAKNFSSHINYDKLKEIFPGGSPATEGSTPEDSGQGASPAASGSSRQPTHPPPAIEIPDEDEDAEGEYDDQPVDYVEDFDDPQQYLEDDDEGFGDANYDDDY